MRPASSCTLAAYSRPSLAGSRARAVRQPRWSRVQGSLSEDSPSPSAGKPKENGITNVFPTLGTRDLLIKNMAEALTQWGKLNPPQGDVSKKRRNLVLLGLPISKPDVISQLEHREELERDVSKAASPEWETVPESKKLTQEKHFSEEESSPGVLLESFPEEGSRDCEDSLENQWENHEKHPI